MNLQYWNDWLGLSDDYEAALSEANRLWKSGGGEERENTTVIFNGYPQNLDEWGCKDLAIDRMGPGYVSEEEGRMVTGSASVTFFPTPLPRGKEEKARQVPR